MCGSECVCVLLTCLCVAAFKFCLNYQRRTEFRKLCEIVSLCRPRVKCNEDLFLSPLQLKNHLLQAQKYQFQSQHSLRFDNPDTIQFLVDVRFEQLECSINVDLWQVSLLLSVVSCLSGSR